MEGDKYTAIIGGDFSISIHTLRMEGDLPHCHHIRIWEYFNPHPPHGGWQSHFWPGCPYQHFNPHPPHGGWPSSKLRRSRSVYFNPHPPHGGWPDFCDTDKSVIEISIHTLRMEGDLKNGVVQYYLDPFQSTPSAWRVTWYILLTDQDGDISIHTLRMEGDHGHHTHRPGKWISIHTLRMEGDSKFA